MKEYIRIAALSLCLAMVLGLFAGLAPRASAGNELPIIPINPHTHTWDEGTVTVAPTCTEEGEMTYHCTTCTTGVKTEPIDALGHDYQPVVTAPSCTEAGYTTYTCSRCKDSYTDDGTDALGHSFGGWTQTTAPTCTEKGEERRDCSRCDAFETREVEELGHNYQPVVTDPTCTEAGYTTYTCSRCKDSYTADETAALGHDWDDGVQTPASCTAAGNVTYTCRRCHVTRVEAVSAEGHTPGEAVRENEVAPTCLELGGYDTVIYCTVCKAELSREHTELPANGHTPGEAVKENEIAPTCTEIGGYDTVIYCTVCGTELSREHTEEAALGHNFVNGVCTVCGAKDPDYVPENPFVDVDEDDWFADAVLWAISQEPVITSGTDATHFSPGSKCTRAEIVQFLWNAAGKPEAGSDKSVISSLVLSEVEGEARNPSLTAEAGDTDFSTQASRNDTRGTANPFVDVSEDDWYYKAVMWAVANGITSGTDETHFSPTKKCTRAEVVQFLWNAAGNPNPDAMKRTVISTECSEWRNPSLTAEAGDADFSTQASRNDMKGTANPFVDVSENAWYYTAVQWAVARGITSGTDATHFTPSKACTRAEVVQFLYKAA